MLILTHGTRGDVQPYAARAQAAELRPQRGLTAHGPATAIRRAVTDPAMSRAAAVTGERIRTESDVHQAFETLESRV